MSGICRDTNRPARLLDDEGKGPAASHRRAGG